MTQTFQFLADSEADTARLGAWLADLLPQGSVVALVGTLGAGKTRLVQAIAEHCGIDRRDVVSPTFVLVHEYRGRRLLYHIDAYRLRDEEEHRLGRKVCSKARGSRSSNGPIAWRGAVCRASALLVHIEVAGGQSGLCHGPGARYPTGGGATAAESGVW